VSYWRGVNDRLRGADDGNNLKLIKKIDAGGAFDQGRLGPCDKKHPRDHQNSRLAMVNSDVSIALPPPQKPGYTRQPQVEVEEAA
jgi:hypothetical protein